MTTSPSNTSADPAPEQLLSPRPRWNLSQRAGQFPILAAMLDRVLICDGAMGTMIQRARLTIADYEGKEGCPEILCRMRPDVIADIHRQYFAAGADVVETNSFGSTPLVLAEYAIAEEAFDLSRRSAAIARAVADEFTKQNPRLPRFVAGSVGPTTKLVSLGHLPYDELFASYVTQIHGLLAGGIDIVQIETAQDILGVKCAVLAARRAMQLAGREVPIIAQVTIETTGTMLIGTEIAAALPALEALDIDVIGLNCATGPDLMHEHVRFLGENASRLVSVLPNAGLPRNENGVAKYDLTPESLADFHERFVRDYGVALIGGCCGTNPAHIAALSSRLRGPDGKTPRPAVRPQPGPSQATSLYLSVNLRQDPPPLIIGERSNANGSKKFRELLLREDFDGLVEIGREQIAEGAHLIDVCVAYVGRDEVRDMQEVLRRYSTQINLPLVIDTTQLDVLEAALKMLGGRAIVNSVNLEDGEEKANRVCQLAREYGAGLIALTIDEEGMAKTAARKIEVARRLYDIVCGRWGIDPGALLFDPLTFTIGSGDADSRDAAIQTLEGVQGIKEALPGVKTVLGVSNVSFGLKPYPRQILNSVFLAEAIQVGLDAAIVSPAKILPLAKLSPDDIQITRDLIYDQRREGYDPLFAFMSRFADAKADAGTVLGETGPLEERLARRIIDGKKLGIETLLEEALNAGYKPLDIINKILLEGMKRVGDLFGSGQMQLPFVLQSAETMKTAVAYLEPFMERLDGSEKGVIVLATVKGDVHDIGKNLVDIILSNNGYRVLNLGIKQPADAILEAAEREKADAIGMSGLLVKSTVVMKENLELMASRGLSIPVLCGGAALTRGYVEGALSAAYRSGEVYYGADAFTGLRLMDELCGHVAPEARTLTGPGRKKMQARSAQKALLRTEREEAALALASEYAPSDVPPAQQIPKPPFFGTRILSGRELDLNKVFPFINRRVLFRGQWQYRRGRRSESEYRHFVAETVEPKFHYWCQRVIERKWLEPQAIYGFFPCYSDGNDLVVLHPPGSAAAYTEAERFAFPRQPQGRRLCISDFFRKRELAEKEGFDVVGVSVVTVGAIASQTEARLFEKHRYDDYLHFHGLAVETAEGLAEFVHKRARHDLGISAFDAPLIEQLFGQGYQGSRYSFGYPACPRLEDHVPLFRLLGAERIGLSLSEEFQIVPEQSTAALLCHHPEAKYFSITAQ